MSQPHNGKKTGNLVSDEIKKFTKTMGPGIVTGAADDDPSGILTYSQAGAQFGLSQLWTVLFMLPLMVAVQEMSARIGIVTNKGISRVIKENYSEYILYFIIALLFAANTINLGADLGAMAAVARLIVDIPAAAYLVVFFALILFLEIKIPYHTYARILKWLTVSLFAYVITGFIVGRDWSTIFHATFFPHIEFNFQFIMIITGVLGTTISPYMFFWQCSQEIEENAGKARIWHNIPKVSKKTISRMRLDTAYGMFFSELATWFIIITTALVLYASGVRDITNASQAASALKPLVHAFPYAGKISEILFALGIIGTGLLAIPIFAATSSYAISELFSWKESLEYNFKKARPFYIVIVLGMVIGLAINFLGINPIKALVYTAVINGIVAVPMILMLILITGNKKIMGEHTSGLWSKFFSWIAFSGMGLAALLTIYGLFK